MTLVAYAGKDPTERPVNKPRVRRYRRPAQAYRLFLGGRDTAAISGMLDVKESIILRWITNERCNQRELSNPYLPEAT